MHFRLLDFPFKTVAAGNVCLPGLLVMGDMTVRDSRRYLCGMQVEILAICEQEQSLVTIHVQ